MKLHIMQFAALSCYFVPLRSKYSAQCPVLRHPYRHAGNKRTKELPPNTDFICFSITAVKTRWCSDNRTPGPVPYSCLDYFCLKFTNQDDSYFPKINILSAELLVSVAKVLNSNIHMVHF